MLACKAKSCAKKRVSWAPLLERRLAGRKFPEGLRAKPLAALECLFAGAGGLPFLLHVMPVSMRVAEFTKSGERKIDYNTTGENARTACIVQAKALKTNPSICSGCTPPRKNIDRLQ